MDFDYSPKTKELQARLQAFMDQHIYPNEARYHEEIAENRAKGNAWVPLQLIEDLKPLARQAGLAAERDVSGSAFGKQFKRADRSGAPWAAVIGDSEAAGGVVVLKDLRGEQPERQVPGVQLVALVKESLAMGSRQS